MVVFATLEAIVGGVETLVGASQVYASVAPNGAQKSLLFTNMHNKAKALAIVRAPEGVAEPKNPDEIRETMVASPLVRCLQRMVMRQAPWPYVFYAPPSSGKTSAARGFMHVSIPNMFKDEKKRPNALMLTGSMELGTRNYFNHISDTFGAGSTPWFSSLVAALSRTEEEMDAGKEPSLLILDDFDSEGKDDVNIGNMKKFCHDLARLRDINKQFEFFVVIITQNKAVANKLCKINNWKKISPMPGSYTTPVEDPVEFELPDPSWTGLPWESEQLKKMVQKRFTADELADVEWEALCSNGAIPGYVLKEVKDRSRRKSHDVQSAESDYF